MFNIFCVIFIIFGAFLIVFGAVGISIDVLFGVIFAVFGLAMIFLGISIKKLSKIEDKIAKYQFLFNEENAPLVKCEKCGRRYEVDVDECPYCEVKRVKKAYTRTFDEEK